MNKKYPFEGTEEWYSTAGPRRAIIIINWEVGELVTTIKKAFDSLPLEQRQKLIVDVDKHRDIISQKLESLSSHLKIFGTK
jgi:hypothetical protein